MAVLSNQACAAVMVFGSLADIHEPKLVFTSLLVDLALYCVLLCSYEDWSLKELIINDI